MYLKMHLVLLMNWCAAAMGTSSVSMTVSAVSMDYLNSLH